MSQPAFSGIRAIPTITLFSERVSEYNAYLRTTVIGGVASLEYRRWPSLPITFAYSMDLGRTEAQPALFCAVFNLCDREDRNEHEVLMDHADAERDRIVRIADRYGLSVKNYLALIRIVKAIDDLHRRRFSGSVFSNDRMDRAFMNRQRHVVVGNTIAVKNFSDVFKL